jgi:hypothetical protein
VFCTYHETFIVDLDLSQIFFTKVSAETMIVFFPFSSSFDFVVPDSFYVGKTKK